MASSRVFPYFDIGSESREVIENSEARAGAEVTRDVNPDDINTFLIPPDEPFLRDYLIEAVTALGTAYFGFDSMSSSRRYADILSTQNLTSVAGESLEVRSGLLREDDGSPKGSALFIPSGESIFLRLPSPAWPGTIVFWLQTEGPGPSPILSTTPVESDEAPADQGSFIARLEESGQITLETLDESDTVVRSTTSVDPITDGETHSIIYTDDGVTNTLFIDGETV